MELGFYSDVDFEQLVELFKDAFTIKHIDKELCSEKLHSLLKSNRYKVYVAKEDGKVLSSCVVYIHSDPFDRDFATLWYFATLKDFRGQGIGSKLLKFVVEDLKKEDYDCLYLTTSPDNFACQKASEKAGLEKRYSYRYIF